MVFGPSCNMQKRGFPCPPGYRYRMATVVCVCLAHTEPHLFLSREPAGSRHRLDNTWLCFTSAYRDTTEKQEYLSLERSMLTFFRHLSLCLLYKNGIYKRPSS